MTNDDKPPTLTKKVYEFIVSRGCVTTKEVAEAMGISTTKAYSVLRALFSRRLVMIYRTKISRERIFCIPHVGDKLYGPESRMNSSGMICITLPIDMLEILDDIAIRSGKSRSHVVRDALSHLIETYLRGDGQHIISKRMRDGEEMDFIVPDR